MLDTLNRHLVQPLAAAKARSRHLDYLRVLRRTQFDPPGVVAARQLVSLKAVLRHAWDTVPYYRRAWAAAGVHPVDVRSAADLAAFPVVTKADLRAHEADFVSSAFDRSALRAKRTSGSTGVPVTVRVDERAMQWKRACTIRSDEWSGYRFGRRVARLWGDTGGDVRPGWRGAARQRLLDRAVYLKTIDVTPERMDAFAAELRRRPPGLLFGHAHSLYLFACHVQKRGVADIRPGGVVSTAMPLHGWQRTVIESAFGRPATDRYGCEELSLVASECEHHSGLHLNADGVFAEVLPRPGLPADAGGDLVLTDLVNYGMPLVRYKVGDVATMPTAAGRCPCGRGLPVLGRVEGRDADYVVTPSGGLISGISLTDHFATLIAGAAQVQIVQEEVTHLRVRMVTDGAWTADSRRAVAKLVHDTFGPRMRHDVEVVDAIEQEPSGKYRFCVSKPAREYVRGMSA